MPNPLSEILEFSGKYKYLTYLGCILSGISAIFLLLPLVYVWKCIELLFIPSQNLVLDLFGNAFFALELTLLGMLIYFIALMCTHYSAFENEKNMKNFAMKHILNLPLGFFDSQTSGRLRKNIEYSSSRTEAFLAHMLPDIAGAIVTPIVFIILLFYFDWILGIVCLIPMAFAIMTLTQMFGDETIQFMGEYQSHLEEMNSQAIEYLRGIPVTKTFQQSIFSFKNFHKSILSYGDFVKKYSFSMQMPMTGFTLSVNGFFIVLIPAAILLASHPLDIKLLLNLLFYIIFTPTCSVMVNKIMNLSESIMIVNEVMDKINEIKSYKPLEEAKTPKNPEKYDIALENVSFKYESGNRNAINDINIRINEGETVALVGPSGGGKTTIANLIARFYDVDEGSINIGGINVKDISKFDLNNSISFVFQDQHLFKASVYENIKMSTDASKEEVMNALKLANCEEIINNLPYGIDTILNKDGLYLSGGERQRLTLARAILKDAPIIILDEATAFADPENELEIQNSINEICRNKTVLTIAHRLSTIKDVDKIIVIDEGRVREEGSHEELLDMKGLYHKMWQEYNKSVEWKISNLEETDGKTSDYINETDEETDGKASDYINETDEETEEKTSDYINETDEEISNTLREIKPELASRME